MDRLEEVTDESKSSASYILNWPRRMRDEVFKMAGVAGMSAAALIRLYIKIGLTFHSQLDGGPRKPHSSLEATLFKFVDMVDLLLKLKQDPSATLYIEHSNGDKERIHIP